LLGNRRLMQQQNIDIANLSKKMEELEYVLAKQIQFFKQSNFKLEHALCTLDAIDKCAIAAEIIELANTRDLLNL